MDEAARTRRAAKDAVDTVAPAALHEVIDRFLSEGTMSPGALTISCASTVDVRDSGTEVAQRAAGVQLIYEGLRLTRDLAHTEPWTVPEDRQTGNLQVLAADVMVARGFYLLAKTDAATNAVETVRSFGRAQTRRRDCEADAAEFDAQLEADILELAVITGVTADGSQADNAMRERASALGRMLGVNLPPAEQLLSEFHDGRRAGSDLGADDQVFAPDG